MPSDAMLADAYRAFHRSHELREKFEEMAERFDEEAEEVEVPADLAAQVRVVLDEHVDLRWDDAVQIVLDPELIERVREEKQKAEKKSGDFTGAEDDEEDDQAE
jgi:hypothetical protein